MTTRPIYMAASLAIGAALLAGCGESDDAPAGATKLSFKLTDAGCDPAQADAPAGPVTFEVINDGAAGVTELEVLDGDTILGEKENLSRGDPAPAGQDRCSERVHQAHLQRRLRDPARDAAGRLRRRGPLRLDPPSLGL